MLRRQVGGIKVAHENDSLFNAPERTLGISEWRWGISGAFLGRY